MSTSSNKLISYFKYLLILISLCFIVSILVMYGQNQNKLSLKPNVNFTQSFEDDLKDQSVVVEPKIVGLDHNENPFSIIAKKASYESNKVVMDQIEVTVHLYDDKPTVINADYGIVEVDSKKVTLHDNVKVLFADGDSIFADSILVDYNLGVMSSDKPVLIKSKTNQIKANSFKVINEKGKRKIIFYGKVKAKLQLES